MYSLLYRALLICPPYGIDRNRLLTQSPLNICYDLDVIDTIPLERSPSLPALLAGVDLSANASYIFPINLSALNLTLNSSWCRPPIVILICTGDDPFAYRQALIWTTARYNNVWLGVIVIL